MFFQNNIKICIIVLFLIKWMRKKFWLNKVVNADCCGVWSALDWPPTQLETALIALGFILDPNPVNPEAEICVYALSEVSKLREWNYLTLFIDCIELISAWICILPSYDQRGQFLIARATEGHIFILDARPSKLFHVLGYIGNTCDNINYIFFSLFSAF